MAIPAQAPGVATAHEEHRPDGGYGRMAESDASRAGETSTERAVGDETTRSCSRDLCLVRRATTAEGTITYMQPTTARGLNRIERRLDGLRADPALGVPVRFYFRRREQLLYLVVGGWNTVFGFGAWAVLQFLLGGYLHYLVVVLISWPIAVLNAYVGYRYVVFRSRGSILREFPRFSLVYVVTLVVNLALLPIALHVLPLNIYAVQALLTVLVVVCSYLSHKHFSFGGGHRGRSGDTSSHDLSAGQES